MAREKITLYSDVTVNTMFISCIIKMSTIDLMPLNFINCCFVDCELVFPNKFFLHDPGFMGANYFYNSELVFLTPLVNPMYISWFTDVGLDTRYNVDIYANSKLINRERSYREKGIREEDNTR